MVDNLSKSTSLRRAIASARLSFSIPETAQAIQNRQVPKGDVKEFARAAGLLAIKNTSSVIPDCHPLPVEYAAIRFEMGEMYLDIEVEVATIYKTGVEVEAMHGAAITALTAYDMLKPIDRGIQIEKIVLQQKMGGKSDYSDSLSQSIRGAVLVCSDSVSSGKKEDKAGREVVSILEKHSIACEHYHVVPDEKDVIQQCITEWVSNGIQLLIVCGGTGLSPRDQTPEAVQELLDREIPGIMEAARAYGQQRTPYAMLSRGIAGMRKQCLILTLPGSARGASESMQALFPYLKHVFKVAAGMRHD
ncbi:MAG TPA: bifunctional molybdenum cofactor biosynthesis protein MoaC/MoaB [Chitinophagaceae bacterium]|nr:bifunctional molybdenum cofactor biosynthesis protein MoaC/MoaB [Chitinophagaceae bacterium]